MTALWVIVLCGALSIVYAIWATASVLNADAGNPRMQEIAAAVREGAQAYLKRQYMTIGLVGIVIFALLAYFLGMLVAVGFLIGAVLSGAAGFIGIMLSRDVLNSRCLCIMMSPRRSPCCTGIAFPITSAGSPFSCVALRARGFR